MSNNVVVDLFVEDRAHEEFIKPFVERIATAEHVEISLRVRSAKGGHPRAIEEFKLYQRIMEKGVLGEVHPDLLIVGIDGNCTTFAKKKKEIQEAATTLFSDRLVVACPDPHVERWYLADPDSFYEVVGRRPTLGKKKCARDHYKGLLSKAIRAAGHPSTLGGIEFARELVEAMDLYRAGKNDRSLKAFVDELRAALRTLRRDDESD